MEEFGARRDLLSNKMSNNSIAIIFAEKIKVRNRDSDYLFRQNSTFYYFTGIIEPEAVLVLLKQKDQLKYILFGLDKNIEQEIWTGQRIGIEDAKAKYGADEAYSISELDSKLASYARDNSILYYPFFDTDFVAESRLKKIWQSGVINNLNNFSDELRLIKSKSELDTLAMAASISAKAHIALMQACRPDMYEYELQALFYQQCVSKGCQDLAYPSIVAGGINACTLHYTSNRSKLVAKQMLLVDAGGELNCYASDITRSYPINGKFSSVQQDLYMAVLNAQLAGIKACIPGNTIEDIQQAVLQELVPALVKLKILSGSVKNIIKDKLYRDVYMHNCSHWLGLDVHDVGAYKQNSGVRKLEPGMVLTIEPGVYLGAHLKDIPKDFQGIGIRIEDTVAVTKKSCNILSFEAPKDVEGIEQLMQ